MGQEDGDLQRPIDQSVKRVRIITYVAWRDLEDHLAVGWLPLRGNSPTHHDGYNLSMEWLCDCKPPLLGRNHSGTPTNP